MTSVPKPVDLENFNFKHVLPSKPRKLGDVVQAKKLAGYNTSSSTSSIVESLKDEIFDATKTYMSRVGPKAAVAYASALDDPTQLGIKEKMMAAGQILDRAGLIKTERVSVESTGGLFILPPKNSDEAEA